MSDLWEELIEYARWTPSPHNVQAWKVKIISSTHAELYYDPARLLPETDPTGCFTIAGFAMFVECLNIAAHSHGLRVKPEYHLHPLDHHQTQPVLLADLHLTATTHQESLNPDLILTRRTSRLPYNNQPVETHVITELQTIAQTYGHTFTTSNDPELIAWIMDLNRDTLFYDMQDPKTRKELGELIRFTQTQAFTKKDGLWSYCMHFPGWLMYLFFQYEWLFELPIIKQLVFYYYMTTMKGVRTIAWLQGPFTTPQDWITSGYALIRLWLTMTKHNVYLHPFGSIITNPTAHKRLVKKFHANEQQQPLWLIMRLGYSQRPPRSLRLSVEDILI